MILLFSLLSSLFSSSSSSRSPLNTSFHPLIIPSAASLRVRESVQDCENQFPLLTSVGVTGTKQVLRVTLEVRKAAEKARGVAAIELRSSLPLQGPGSRVQGPGSRVQGP
eukprot:2495237-Rhodomonas_salina.1